MQAPSATLCTDHFSTYNRYLCSEIALNGNTYLLNGTRGEFFKDSLIAGFI